MTVSDLMSRQVATVRAGDPASAAARVMWDCDCGSVPVVDDDGRVIAMVTDRDLCMTAMFQDRPLGVIGVSEAMSKSIYACSADDSVADVEGLMRRHQIRRVPVLDADRRPVGMLSLADIVRAAGRDKVRGQGRARKSEVIPEELTAMLADICTPRQPSGATEASVR